MDSTIRRIEQAFNERLDWLKKRADGDAHIIREVEMVRKNFGDVCNIYRQALESAVRGLSKTVEQRDGYITQVLQIETDLENLDEAVHPLMQKLATIMRDEIDARVNDRAEELFHQRYEQLLTDTVEYAMEKFGEQEHRRNGGK